MIRTSNELQPSTHLVLSKIPVVQHSGGYISFVILVALVAKVSTGKGADSRFPVDESDLSSAVASHTFEVLDPWK